MRSRLVACLLAIASALPLRAGEASDAVLDALDLPGIVQIMRDEGIDYGREMAADLLPEGSHPGWQAAVSAIYDTGAMEQVVRRNFGESFGDTDPAPLLEFFGSSAGERVVDLEISARRAMIDNDVEASARATFRGLEGGADTRMRLLDEFIEANDLIESNVVGALNASYQFYLGLVDGGAFEMTEGEILSEVWGQEEETRADTREWLYAYLLLAYRPMSDKVLMDYVKLSATEEGKAMNRALFAGFNGMYDEISYALGLAAAQQMKGQDL
ncbi:hypothetical protein [Salipiger sp.]|uniref:hypothetical protein n=1 Tax=Salipiger sp. TaxID=2078585 RepID=UPI003A96DD57